MEVVHPYNNHNSRDVSLYFAIARLRLDEDVIIGGSLNLYRLSSVLFNQCSMLLGKCVCPLQIAHVYLASRGFAPRPPPRLCPWTPLGDFRPPDPLCPPYLQTLATPLILLVIAPLLANKACRVYAMYVHILKVWRFLKNPTLSIDSNLLVEQSCRITSRSDLKRRSLRFRPRYGSPNATNVVVVVVVLVVVVIRISIS